MLILAVAACCMAFALETSKLKSGTVQSLSTRLDGLNSSIYVLSRQLNSSINVLSRQLNSSAYVLSKQFNNEAQQLDQLQNLTYQLIDALQRPGQESFSPAPSCAALPPSSPSGYYWVRASNGSAVRVYCDMTLTCGNITGGWMRVAYLDMTNSSHQCPSGLRQHTDSSIRTCVRDMLFTWLFCSAIFYN